MAMFRNLKKLFTPNAFHPETSSRVLFDFTRKEGLDKWITATDKDFFGGFSEAKVEHHPDGFARFTGELSTEIPSGSKIERSGFALMRSKIQPVRPIVLLHTNDFLISSCERECIALVYESRLAVRANSQAWHHLQKHIFDKGYLDMGDCNMLEFVLRGDGRAYIANIQSTSLQEADLYQSFLYTRGGPSWQTIHVPLSDFLLTHMGYVQNEQTLLSNKRVRSIGLLLADQVNGPFQLDVMRISALRRRKDLTNMDVDGPKASMKYTTDQEEEDKKQ
eukprot:TRINITY_DN11990_c0_g1_i5.p1 TRINITY_DN11990_c0_g1~~TRINITY_DN11990_c0_g1_i5.p1  ORF type:complete len:277 (+),score=51.69 TRINITY_DN11990_c0_g1_i5:94-924(+)